MRIVVLSPHRDDAAFSISLSIISWLSAGHSVHVMNCFTRSAYAPLAASCPDALNDQVGHVTGLRSREDEAWVRACGPGLTRQDLGLDDAPLRLHCEVDNVCTMPMQEGDYALEEIRDATSQQTYDALALPLALGTHVDHCTVREAAMRLYSPSSACAFYEDLPYATRPGVAGHIAELAEQVRPEVLPVFTSGACDAEAAVGRKRRLALCYASQIDQTAVDDMAHFSMQYGGRERLWANPAWERSTLTFEDALI